MNKGWNRTFEFVIKTFFIAVAVNAVVALTVIHYDTDNAFAELPGTFVFITGISLACFFPVCLIIFLIAWLNANKNQERIYWIIMVFGVIATGLLFTEFRNLFAKYSDKTDVFSIIAIFSILVSITSQYQLFIGPGIATDDEEEPVINKPKTFDPDDTILGR